MHERNGEKHVYPAKERGEEKKTKLAEGMENLAMNVKKPEVVSSKKKKKIEKKIKTKMKIENA